MTACNALQGYRCHGRGLRLPETAGIQGQGALLFAGHRCKTVVGKSTANAFIAGGAEHRNWERREVDAIAA
jgi:hypothetical protein